MKNNKGFTLIELLAVILILGIIALIAIPTVSSVVEQSRKGATESTGLELVKGAEKYLMKLELDSSELPADCGDEHNRKCTVNDIKKGEKSILHGVTDLGKTFDVKGDLPDINDITEFTTDADDNVIIEYTQDGYTCSNIVNDKAASKVSCEK